MNRVFWLAVLTFSFSLLTASLSADDKGDTSAPLRVLLVSGGHWFDRENLTKMILDRPNTTLTEIELPADQDRLQSGITNDFDVLVFHDQSRFALSDEQKANLEAMWAEGTPTVMLHHALIAHNDFTLFRNVYGTAFLVEPMKIDEKEYPASTYKHPTEVNFHFVNKEHPITAGLNDFTLTDEVFGNLWLADDNDVLIETDHPESSRPICWTRWYKKSPVFVMIQGHDGTAFGDTRYREIFYRGLDWVAAQGKSQKNAQALKSEIEQITAEPFAGKPEDYEAFVTAKGEKIAPLAERLLAEPNLSSEDRSFGLKNGIFAISLTSSDEKIAAQKVKAFLDAHQNFPETETFYQDWIDRQFYAPYDVYYDRNVPAAEKATLFRQTVEPLLDPILRYYPPERDSNQQLPSILVDVADRVDPDGSAGLVLWLNERLKPLYDRDAQSQDYLLAILAKRTQGAAHRIQSLGQPLEYSGCDINGQKFSVAENHGKVTLVLFVYSYIYDEQLPALKKLFAALGHADLELIVQFENIITADQWRDQYGAEETPWTVTVCYPPDNSDQGRYRELYGMLNNTSLLYDREGKLVQTRPDGLTPELCDFLATLFPEQAAALTDCADTLRAALDETAQKQKNYWWNAIQQEKDAETLFGRLVRLRNRILNEPTEMDLEMIDQLLAAADTNKTRGRLLVEKARGLSSTFDKPQTFDDNSAPDQYLDPLLAFLDEALNDENIPLEAKYSLASERTGLVGQRLRILKEMTKNQEDFALKTLDCFIADCRRQNLYASEDTFRSSFSQLTQYARFMEQEFENLDEKNGSKLLQKFYETLGPFFAQSQNFDERKMAERMAGSLRRVSMLGQEFELAAVLRDGTLVNVKDWRGKVVLVNFWGTSCGPCIREFPAMKALYEKYHDAGYEMIAISYDTEESLDKFLEKTPYPWMFSLLSHSEQKGLKDYYAYYGIQGIPMTFLLDRDGKVRFMQVGSNDEALKQQVDQLFSAP